MKKSLSLLALGAAAVLGLSACGTGSSAQSEGTDKSESSQSAPASAESYQIGITQLMSHPSLDAARDGFVQAIEDAGLDVTFDEQNANGDQSVASSIAGTFNSGNYDLILAIATPNAQAVAQAITDKPVLFTAITDPVDAGLVDSMDQPGGNMTGTSDANPVKEQLQLIKDVVPDAKKVGIIYSPGEANSVVQVEWAKEAVKDLGLELVEAPAVSSQEVLQAAESLSNVDAIYVPTDNVVVTSLETVLKVGEERQIPVFGAEGDTVARGAIGTYGLSYFDLGYQTGQMAVRILVDGEDPATMPVETLSTPMLYLNKGAAERMGVELPESLLAEVTPENLTE
ncbi:ABC transporter substrate-binding protein [Scrofimicrobium sp. R131]|uniref:ABC transporter substrate-binding protein n=1 Tax=Scrofimicrobium appendicitidis TaxID=3079930 RepID=A0AAU7V506_9ACTO